MTLQICGVFICFWAVCFIYLFIYGCLFFLLLFLFWDMLKKKKTSLTGSLDRSRRMSFFHYFLLLNYFYVKTNNGVTLQ